MRIGRGVAALLALLGLFLVAGGTGATATATAAKWPAWVPLDAVSPVSTPGPPTHIVVLGDSVAAGTGCACPSFGALLARRAGAAALQEHARDGMTARELAEALTAGGTGMDRDLRTADVVTVTIGANDFPSDDAGSPDCAQARCYAADLASLRTSLPAVLSGVHVRAPQARVFVTGYWNVFLDGAVGRRRGPAYVAVSDALTRQVNGVIAAAARAQHATYVDLYAPFKGAGDRDDTALLAPDGDHPSAAGHLLIASLLWRAVTTA